MATEAAVAAVTSAVASGRSGGLGLKFLGRRRHGESAKYLADIADERKHHRAGVVQHAVKKRRRVELNERGSLARENSGELLRFVPVPILGKSGNPRNFERRFRKLGQR